MAVLNRHHGPIAKTTVASLTNVQAAVAALFLAAHIPLALVMRESSIVSTLHAVITLGVGLVLALTTRAMRILALVVCYIAGAEVLWRMTGASVFWEFGKYSIIAILSISLLRMKLKENRVVATLYFVVLIPSILITFETLNLDEARDVVSFYLSGPLAICVAVLFFSNVRLTTEQLHQGFWGFIGPVVGVATLSLVSTRSVTDLAFGNNSSFVTSGSFGPNQVAAVLGLSAMFLLLIVVERTMAWRFRVALIALAATAAAQAALTFSRGGIALAFLGICAALFFLVRRSGRSRVIVLAIALVSFVLGNYVVAPELDSFTSGKLGERYANTRSSGRDQFVSSEFEMFQESPILGVGPGIGAKLRAERGLLKGPSHTEYSRMLAEHGLFGAFAIVCLLVLASRAFRRAKDPVNRANTVALILWFAASIGIYGTRIAAPAVVFGLAFALVTVSSKRTAAA